LEKLDTVIATQTETTLVTKSGEFNNVLGGGIVPGSVVLLSGEPGI
jgi:DNA repair protein RadA/Sms